MVIQTFQISELLIVAQQRLVYCKYIIEFPKKQGMKNFDVAFLLDSFYKNMCNVCFQDSLLITATLLDKDPRVISFKNWLEKNATQRKKLKEIIEIFESSGLKGVRDQVFGHADISNHNNRFPTNRTTGIIDNALVKKLDEIQIQLVELFHEYVSERGSPYAPFDFNLRRARDEIDVVISLARPKMTNDTII